MRADDQVRPGPGAGAAGGRVAGGASAEGCPLDASPLLTALKVPDLSTLDHAHRPELPEVLLDLSGCHAPPISTF
ncbi:MAG TPA: hypothetical protein VK425_12410, partial [Acidimicrobiales bacterium]|nr:hypothetical protein [Acidimicrobiales bacterium]